MDKSGARGSQRDGCKLDVLWSRCVGTMHNYAFDNTRQCYVAVVESQLLLLDVGDCKAKNL